MGEECMTSMYKAKKEREEGKKKGERKGRRKTGKEKGNRKLDFLQNQN